MRRYNAHQFRVDESPDGALVFFSEVEGLLLSNQRLRKELDHYKRLAEAAEAVIKYLITRNHNGFIGLNFPQYLTYQSIKQEAHHE